MKKNNYYISSIILLVFLMISCKTSEKKHTKISRVKSKEEFIKKISQAQPQVEWVSIKSSVAFKTDKASDSFKIYFRLRKDSAIWISATYYAVEVARLIITPDTLKYMDRKNNQYFIGNIDYLNKKFDVDFDYQLLENILLGSFPASLSAKDIKLNYHKKHYEVYTYRKRWIKKASDEKKSRFDEKIDEKLDRKNKATMMIYAQITPQDFRPKMLQIIDLISKNELQVQYKKYQIVDSVKLPLKVALNIRSSFQMTADLEYLKTKINRPLKMSFTIPEKYEKIK